MALWPLAVGANSQQHALSYPVRQHGLSGPSWNRSSKLSLTTHAGAWAPCGVDSCTCATSQGTTSKILVQKIELMQHCVAVLLFLDHLEWRNCRRWLNSWFGSWSFFGIEPRSDLDHNHHSILGCIFICTNLWVTLNRFTNLVYKLLHTTFFLCLHPLLQFII